VNIQPCPECRAGKHRNCDGTSWDTDLDLPARCPCDDQDHILLGVAYPEGSSP